MLRVATAGSVDDGKSTLIGRLLFDAKALMADQEAGLEDLANLTDGLRAELWSLYNGRIRRGEHVRVFPISNWTELDVWEYILAEELEIPGLYVAHEREVFERDGMLYAVSDFVERMDGEEPFTEWVRYRTVGDIAVTGAVASEAATLPEVVAEIAATRVTERGETRADDRVSEAAMEDRKREGYF